MSHVKPRIAVTMGDPAGIGPELSLRIASDPQVTSCCVPIVFGDHGILRSVATLLHLPLPDCVATLGEIDPAMQAATLDMRLLTSVAPGQISAETGQSAYRYVEAAVSAARDQHVAAVVTGPVHKEAFALAGIAYPGHTELLKDQTKADRVCMMLTSATISCSLVTAHVGFKDVLPSLTTQAVLNAIELSHEAIQRIRNRSEVRLSVCGLNPHAGECGLFGSGEEERVIEPAIDAAQRKGIRVVGPLPPDSAFTPAWRDQTDCYVCMYHDQGLIPVKALAFDTAVNVTLGLPIIRTSVDHGTALDIAWQGKASSTSFVEAVLLAVKLAEGRSSDAMRQACG